MVVKIENVTDENDIKFLTILDKHGWHVMHVHNRVGETEPEFSYSTGIYKNFGKPELMVRLRRYATEPVIPGDIAESSSRP